jgi:hypothetical protein
LDRLNRDVEFRASFSMQDAAQLLEGCIEEFHPAARYRTNASQEGPPVRLVELFTCIDHAPTMAAELAFGGLGEYLDATEVAFIEYHVPVPEPDPLVSAVAQERLAFYGPDATPTAYFDGLHPVTSGGSERNVDGLFSEYRSAADTSADAGTQPWRIEGQIALFGKEIRGEIALNGPTGGDGLALHAVLCEQIVMVPGANGLLLHRHVARAGLSPPSGFEVSISAGRRVFSVAADTSHIANDLEQVLTAMETEHKIRFIMRPTYVDGRACVVVALLQDHRTKHVLAARVLPMQAGEGSPE